MGRKRHFLLPCVLFILFFSRIDVCYAQQDEGLISLPEEAGILPTSPLYFLKTAYEKVRVWLTQDPLHRAELRLEAVGQRLAEAQALTAEGKNEMVAKLLLASGEELQRVWENLELARHQEQAIESLRIRFQEKIGQREELVNHLQSTAEGQLREALRVVAEKDRELLRQAAESVDKFGQEATPSAAPSSESHQPGGLKRFLRLSPTFISPLAD